MSRPARCAPDQAILDVIALLSGSLETGGGELLDEALDGVLVDLGRASGYDLAVAFGTITFGLLDRLAIRSGRDRDELWQEMAHALTVSVIERGESSE